MRILKIVAMVLLSMPFWVTAFAARPGKQLQTLLKNMHTMQASFTQKVYNTRGKVIRSSRGTMALQRPGQFRWQIKSPTQLIMVADGKRLWIYDKALAQVTVKNLKRGGNNPAMILSGHIKLLTNYVRVQYAKGWFYLRPRYGGTLLKMIKLHFKGKKLQKMWLFDKLGQRSYFRFYNIKINKHVDKSLFRFKPPKGVDVIKQAK